MNLLMIIDGAIKGDFVTGGVVVLVSILMVFVILLVIIGLTEIVGKLLNKSAVETAEPVKDGESNGNSNQEQEELPF